MKSIEVFMDKPKSEASNVHIFRPKAWAVIQNLLTCFIFLIPLGLFLVMFITFLDSAFDEPQSFQVLMVFINILMAILILILGYGFLQQITIVILIFFSFIRTSPDGIELKYVPFKHIRCAWSDVDKLGKYLLISDAIYLKSYEVIGPSISLKIPFKIIQPMQGMIGLSGYKGWPSGILADDLRHYAPHLFKSKSTEVAANTKDILPTNSNPNSGNILVSLSHASILLNFSGLIVPIIAYITEKQKSVYCRFQTLQALIWQGISLLVVNILLPNCMVITILFVGFAPLISGIETTPEPLNGNVLVFTILVTILIIVMNLFFIIYGLIGAYMTYQGKDFRYIFIANILEKRIKE
jgi:hypothetical protein